MRWRSFDGALLYLSRYSSELNPDEMASADIKQAVVKPAPARTKKRHLVKATARHLRCVQRQPERIRKGFEHGAVRYAACFKLVEAVSMVLRKNLAYQPELSIRR